MWKERITVGYKLISIEEALTFVQDGMTVMIGGFLTNGRPEFLVKPLVEKRLKHLTIISNDAGSPGNGIAELAASGAIDRLIATHIGLNPAIAQMINDDAIEVTLVPQGTFVERIRAGGAGLGGVLTPTGLGTEVAEGKEIIVVDEKEYLLEKPLRADIALLQGSVVDEEGNIFYKGTTRNFNPMMALAADRVIAVADSYVSVGSIPCENVVTPGILVDHIVKGESA